MRPTSQIGRYPSCPSKSYRWQGSTSDPKLRQANFRMIPVQVPPRASWFPVSKTNVFETTQAPQLRLFKSDRPGVSKLISKSTSRLKLPHLSFETGLSVQNSRNGPAWPGFSTNWVTRPATHLLAPTLATLGRFANLFLYVVGQDTSCTTRRDGFWMNLDGVNRVSEVRRSNCFSSVD
jgi:hypothetical protein